MEQEDVKTSFGFRDVAAEDKAAMVRDVFDAVAGKYDLMNDLMSGGVHRIWKSILLDRLNPRPGQRLVDVAGGTGDIAVGFLKRAADRAKPQSAEAAAVVCDINEEMLHAGIYRQDTENLSGQLTRVNADAEALPFSDGVLDAYTIGFGIRNVTDRATALEEAFRVLKPGGRFICLEFSHPITAGLQKLYDAYSFKVIPWLGAKVAGDKASYEYLVESIRRFPLQDAFALEVQNAGFSRVHVENLTGGIAALHMAWRI